MIIDRSDCEVGLPNPALEDLQHLPLARMRIQSTLIRQLSAQFGSTKNITDPADIEKYQRIIKTWVKELPPPYDILNPDKPADLSSPWVALHRHCIRTVALSMLLDPVRAFLGKEFRSLPSEAELKIHSHGVDLCIELMTSLHSFFDFVHTHDAKFHLVLFSIFDTAAILCAAVLHDRHHTLLRREDIFKAIDDAHTMLRRLRGVTKSACTPYSVLSRIRARLPRAVTGPKDCLYTKVPCEVISPRDRSGESITPPTLP